MKMSRFRIQNYKKVQDTDWISCDNLTVFVGKNEAGKSAIFRGLSKLNPSDNEKYDGLKEFPRRRYTSEFKEQDWPVTSVEFELEDEEKENLKNICPILKNIQKVICIRHYSWKLNIIFEPEPTLPNVSNNAFLEVVKELISQVQELTAPEGKGENLKQIKNTLIPIIERTKNSLVDQQKDQQVTPQVVESVFSAFSTHANENWEKDTLNPMINKLQEFKSDMQSSSKLNDAKKWIESNIPNFIYFDRYDIIDSAIHVVEFSTKLQQNPLRP